MSVGSCMACETEVTPRLVKIGRFDELLSDSALYDAFDAFLQREFAEENLYFFKDVIVFEHAAKTEADDVLKKKANELVAKYLGNDATPRVLNIGELMIADIQTALAKKKFDKDLFMPAKLDIQSILRTKYISFCET